MVKAIALIKRKPGLSREEFRRHYEEVHAPLILKTAPNIVKYVRNHVIVPGGAEEPPFDCVTELWFESMEGFKAGVAVWGTEAGKVIRDDEDSFLDRSKLAFFLVDETASKI
ncbi:MAG: EthD domain-containing protein [Chloroflexi bacterium]|nr:EthD domain-containing protein [Chloroflexota bacterium]